MQDYERQCRLEYVWCFYYFFLFYWQFVSVSALVKAVYDHIAFFSPITTSLTLMTDVY